MMITVLAAYVVCIILCRLMMPLLHKLKFGQNVYELAPEGHQKKQGTLTMGGLMTTSATLVTILLMGVITGKVQFMIPFMVLALGNMAIGFLDDMTKIRRHKNGGLTPRQKLIIQTVLALAFAIWCYFQPEVGSTIHVPFLHKEWNLGIFYIPLMTFVIVGTTNSANLLDGLDGLLTSVSIADMATLTILCVATGMQGLGISTAAVCGACMAFLVVNCFPAKVFMGDTGSMFLGGAVSAAALLLKQPLILLLIAFWMMMSSVSDLIQFAYFRATHGKRIFKMAPIHHHFELCGMHENRIVMMYMTTTILLCLVTLMGVL